MRITRWVPPVYLLRNTLQHYTLMQSAPLWIVFQTGTTEYIHSVYSRFWDENGFLYWFSILEHTILYLVAQYIPLCTDARRFDYYYTKYILRILPLSFFCAKNVLFPKIFFFCLDIPDVNSGVQMYWRVCILCMLHLLHIFSHP